MDEIQRERFQDYQFTEFAVNVILLDLFPDHKKLQQILSNEKNRLERPVCYVIGRKAILDEFNQDTIYKKWIDSGLLRLWSIEAWSSLLNLEMENPRSSLFARNHLFFYNNLDLVTEFQKQVQYRLKKYKLRLDQAKQRILIHYANYTPNTKKPKVYITQSCLTIATKKFSRALAQSCTDLGLQTFIHPNCDLSMVDSANAELMEIGEFLPDFIVNAPNVFRRKDDYLNLPIRCIIPLQDHVFNAMGIEYLKQHPLNPNDLIVTHLKRFESPYRDISPNPDQILHRYLPFEPGKNHPQQKSATVSYVKTMLPEKTFFDYLKRQNLAQQKDHELCSNIDQQLLHDIQTDTFALIDARFKLPFGQMVPQWEHHLRSHHWINHLQKNGIDLALYGDNWNQFPSLAPFAHGILEGDQYLNHFSKHLIHLSLNPYTTFHPRIFDGGQFGAFFLISKVPPHLDVNPMPENLVEGTHFDTFSSTPELLEKCNYYLANPHLCAQIGQNLQKEVLSRFTMTQFAKEIFF